MGTVTRNTVFFTSGAIVQKALSFLYFSILAAHYGPTGVGAYSYALAFTTIFAIIVDAGLTPVLIRRIAQVTDEAHALLWRVLKIKSVLALGAIATMFVVLFSIHTARSVWPLISIASVVMLVDSVALTLYGVLRGMQNLTFESAGLVGAQSISLIIGIVAVRLSLPIASAIVGLGIASVANALFAYTVLHKRLAGFHTPTHLSAKKILREAFPFALAGVFARGYSLLDSLLIGSMIGLTATGLYSVANKLTFAFQFIPLALSASLYPAFSRYTTNEHADTIKNLWFQSERYLLIASVFIASAMIGVGHGVLRFYGAAYTRADATLTILAVSLIFSFLSYPLGALLNASGLQRFQTVAMGITLAINAALNIVLIPRMGIAGAAVSALIGNTVLCALGAFFVARHRMVLPWGLFLKIALRVCGIGAVTGVCAHYLSRVVWWPMAGAGALIIFCGLAYLGSVFTHDELLRARRRIFPL